MVTYQSYLREMYNTHLANMTHKGWLDDVSLNWQLGTIYMYTSINIWTQNSSYNTTMH